MSLWLILLQAGLNIAKSHGADGEVMDTGGFLLDAARAVDQLYEQETGQPLDWSTLKHHEHLPPPGEEPTPEPEPDGTEADTAEGPLPEEPPPGE